MNPLFSDIDLTEADFFRAIVLYGRNVASYKFALAHSLFLLAKEGRDFATLEELAIPFSDVLCRHLEIEDKQSTSATSGFLDTLRDFNKGEIDAEEKYAATIRLGFINVIDAFHRVGTDDVSIRFFHDERKSRVKGIRLTDEILRMASETQSGDLVSENESRWRLVETAWASNLPQRLITIHYDKQLESLYAINGKERRQNVTAVAPALNGYQRGKCFYCNRQMYLRDWENLVERGEVDHFFPHVLQRTDQRVPDLDQAWNLVLACNECNGASGKSAQCPDISYVQDLHERNENLIDSHHPMREVIIARTGADKHARTRFLMECFRIAKKSLIHTWKTGKRFS